MNRTSRLVLCLVLCVTGTRLRAADVSPADGATIDTCLTVKCTWDYPLHGPALSPASRTQFVLSQHQDLSAPLVSVDLKENETSYRAAVAPQSAYYWRATAFDGSALIPECTAGGKFTTPAPRIDTTTDDSIRYKNPRAGAHWTGEKPVQFAQSEPLSPWFDRKAYRGPAMPTFEMVKDRLPSPIFDGHADSIDMYWYSWKTLMSVWYFSPSEDDHQAVANLCGYPNWGVWGSTMVFDTAYMLEFARYGHAAYSFVTAMDNCYARQHENGYICRETDKNNREVSSSFPVNPPLFAWVEWRWYEASGDKSRLERVFLPIVKQYEWFMTYQRRENGLYWTNGIQEADDSPRNRLMHSAVSATSYQALAARHLALIARTIGREDLAKFFDAQHAELGEIVNKNFWDEQHGIYNDLDANGRPITELEPGKFCKHIHMFWPLLAGIAPADRVKRVVTELENPASFNRRNGVPSLSADSTGYTGGPNGSGQYWCGAVWPSGERTVEQALITSNQRDEARAIAKKYYAAQLEVFNREKTIKENIAPDQPAGFGQPEFVGWGGIAPIAMFIETILGFQIDAPSNTITWRIERTERHGLERIRLGETQVDLICAARKSPSDPCEITIKCDRPFTLKLLAHGQEKAIAVMAGESHQSM